MIKQFWMKGIFYLIAVLFLLSQPALVKAQLKEDVTREGKIVKSLMPSLVSVVQPKGGGSGFIIDSKGYILTNYHVIADSTIEKPLEVSKRIVVHLHNENKYSAQVIGFDAEFDIALIKIDSDGPLQAMELADSDKVTRGEKCIAMGNPLFIRETATYGAISNPRRATENILNFIQTDAPINPGNSGGPLINMDGKVIGINARILPGSFGQEGIGFAIPINIAKICLNSWMKGEKINKSTLGVILRPLPVELASYYGIDKGAIISSVFEGFSSSENGLKPRDIIVGYNGVPVELAKTLEDVNDFNLKIITTPAGTKLKLEVLRPSVSAKEIKTFEVTAEKRPLSDQEQKRKTYDELGLIIQDVAVVDYYRENLPSLKGVEVLMVSPASPAEKADIEIKDIISKVNDKSIDNSQTFDNIIVQLLRNNDRRIVMEVLHKKEKNTVVLGMEYLLKGKNIAMIVPQKGMDDKIFSNVKDIFQFNGADIFYAKSIEDIKKINMDSYNALVLMPGNIEDYMSEPVYNLIKNAVKSKKVLAAIDNASLLLALSKDEDLKKKNITTSADWEKKMREAGISSTNRELEVDDNVITAISEDENAVKLFAKIIVKLTARK